MISSAVAMTVIASLTMSSPALAQEPLDEQTVQALECAYWAAAQTQVVSDKSNVLGMQIATGYFIGKAKGLTPDLDIQKSMTPALAENMRERMDVIVPRCASEMLEIGNAMVATGKALEQKGY